MKIIETDRLYLRELTKNDSDELEKVLSNPESMKYYPHPFSTKEVLQWIEWNIDNYRKYNHGLWAVILKDGDVFLGDCGITIQEIDSTEVPEIGFHIINKYCNKGYATEAALGVKEFAFQVLGYKKVYSYTTLRNIPSQKVARNIGMKFYKNFFKYNEKQIAHVAIKTKD